MRKASKLGTALAALAVAGILGAASAQATPPSNPGLNDGPPGGRGMGPIIYVPDQGLFYDSIVLANLPPHGPFQLLEMDDGPTGLRTEFGLGDAGYVGGRWWVDANENEVMDDDDAYFLCPLLGPGRDTP